MSFMDKTTLNTKTSTTESTNKTIDLGGQHAISGIYGWICPVCGRGVAPDQKYCNCKPQTHPIYPTYPYWWYQVTCSPNTKYYTTTTTASTKGDLYE